MKLESDQTQSDRLPVFSAILRPLARFALARRVPIQEMTDLLKKLYVSVAEEEFGLPNKRMTDSRVSVLTGLQRKDIKSIRTSTDGEEGLITGAGPLARLIGHWRSAPGYQDESGNPLTLPKAGKEPSFDTLVGMISQDIHPRTLLDDLLSLGLAAQENDVVTLLAGAFIPSADEQALLGYLASNVGDHAAAAVANVLAAPQVAPHFERAVHYNRLSTESLKKLETLSRRLQQETLEQINTEALVLQNQDKSDPQAQGRFRCGSFVFSKDNADQAARKSRR